MSVLDSISRQKQTAIAVTILGDAGVGKSTFASTFPRSVFIRAEDGLASIDIDALPLLASVPELWQQLTALINEEHNYKTVIIDSVTKLESMFIDYVMANDPKQPKSINTALGGYGAGMMAVGAMHSRVRKAAQLLINKGINVVFIAHADTVTIELPDSDPYQRYDLRLGKKSVNYYTDDCDLVAFIKLEAFVKSEDGRKSKVFSDGTRLLTCYATAANVSKNRFGIKEDLVLVEGVNPLVDFIKILKDK